MSSSYTPYTVPIVCKQSTNSTKHRGTTVIINAVSLLQLAIQHERHVLKLMCLHLAILH